MSGAAMTMMSNTARHEWNPKLLDRELDFIINYDIKYRMGRHTENEEE